MKINAVINAAIAVLVNTVILISHYLPATKSAQLRVNLIFFRSAIPVVSAGITGSKYPII